MPDVVYQPHDQQEAFHRSRARIRGAFAGKRGGKTEAGAIESIIFSEQQIGFKDNGIDPYLGVIIAPTSDMLRRLSLKKFTAYGWPFIVDHHKTHQEITWHNGSMIYGISADNPQRLEGVKATWIWMDEVFQMDEAIFLEAIARVSDTEGWLWCTGSLGTQYTNPKAHWCYKHFKDKPLAGSEVFEWTTADNPYYPRTELERLRDTLDPRTFRQMFTIDWSVPGTALVYDEFDDANVIKAWSYNPSLETSVAIDWGWAHSMACLFFQYDRATDTVILFDEIVRSRMTLDQLWDQIKAKPYNINNWFCDIAGNQEREQTAISNIAWFKQRGIHLKSRRTAVQYGIPIVRRFIKDGIGRRKFLIDEIRAPKSLDNIRNYSYPQRDGVITNENPVKQDDDPVDAIRYYFVNRHDDQLKPNAVQMIKR